MGEFHDFDMLDWLLGTNCADGDANANGEGKDDGDSDFQQWRNVSPLQISVGQDCSTELFCDVPMASQLDLQTSLNELGVVQSPLSDVSVLVPDTGDHVLQLLSQEGSPSNLIVDGTSSSGWEFSGGGQGGGKQVQQNEAKAIEDVSLSGKNDCPRKQRSRNAEKHNQAEKKRRHKFNQRIRTLQSLLPEVDKVDTASVLDQAIDYVKSLQLHVNEMWERANPTATPLGASLAALQSFQHRQFGSMEPRSDGEMSFDDRVPVISRPISVSQAMSTQSFLSRASSLPQLHWFPSPPQFHGFSFLPSPLVQMPHPPAGLPFERFLPPHWLGPAALGIPRTLNHQEPPLHTQDRGETSNTIAGRSNGGADSS